LNFLAQLSKLESDANSEGTYLQQLAEGFPISEPFILEVQQKMQELTEQFEFLKSSHPQLFYPDDYVNQGNALFSEGRYENAIAHYNKAVEIQPDNPDVWYRSLALVELQQYEDAIILV